MNQIIQEEETVHDRLFKSNANNRKAYFQMKKPELNMDDWNPLLNS